LKIYSRKEITIYGSDSNNLPEMPPAGFGRSTAIFRYDPGPPGQTEIALQRRQRHALPKQRLSCMLAVPIVYHDPDKELLLTFFPPDLRTPVNEQNARRPTDQAHPR
jgi:hypothetical protein